MALYGRVVSKVLYHLLVINVRDTWSFPVLMQSGNSNTWAHKKYNKNRTKTANESPRNNQGCLKANVKICLNKTLLPAPSKDHLAKLYLHLEKKTHFSLKEKSQMETAVWNFNWNFELIVLVKRLKHDERFQIIWWYHILAYEYFIHLLLFPLCVSVCTLQYVSELAVITTVWPHGELSVTAEAHS